MYIMGNEEVEAVRRVIESGALFRYHGGEVRETESFEREWAELIGVRHVIAVTSGTAALTCGLAGLGVGPGDEVIVPAYTFMASAIAPLAVGAVPIIAEVDESLTLDAADVERKITPRTRAIMPVHMCGLPSDLDAIRDVAQRHGLFVIEDACQADGGSYKGKRLGSHGNAGGFSFNYYKIISCGEGGAVVTDDEEVFERALIFHDGGSAFRDHAREIGVPFFTGMNFRSNEILSAIMRVQLGRLEGILAALRAEKRAILEGLDGLAALTPNPVNDVEGDCGVTVAFMLESRQACEQFMERLSEKGVSSSSPINSGRHVYTNWTPILEKRGAHHPARNAYAFPGVDVEYAPDMCPRTLDILERTVYFGTSVTRAKEDLSDMVAKIREVAESA